MVHIDFRLHTAYLKFGSNLVEYSYCFPHVDSKLFRSLDSRVLNLEETVISYRYEIKSICGKIPSKYDYSTSIKTIGYLILGLPVISYH